ncbi:MAG: 50S ribosomal protein L4 [Nitrososphaeria archaeon]
MSRRVPVYSLDGQKAGEIELPPIFELQPRPDLISRSFWAEFTHRLQPKGTDPMAGKRTSAESFGVGLGIARLARVKGRGYPRAGQAAGVAGVVKGRVAHPPRVDKVIYKRLNVKERRLATAMAIAATSRRDLVLARGHVVPESLDLPVVVSSDLESLSRTRDLRAFLERLGLWPDVERAARRSTRGGKARWRGRARRPGRGPLIVVSTDGGISRAAENIPGVDVVLAKDLSVLDLAPGGHPGRLTIWTQGAISSLPGSLLEVSGIGPR